MSCKIEITWNINCSINKCLWFPRTCARHSRIVFLCKVSKSKCITSKHVCTLYDIWKILKENGWKILIENGHVIHVMWYNINMYHTYIRDVIYLDIFMAAVNNGSIGLRAWINNHIRIKLWDAITGSRPISQINFTQPSFKLENGYMIASHIQNYTQTILLFHFSWSFHIYEGVIKW